MDSRHPDRNALDRYSRGKASTTEERWIEDHLRSGCERCQREVDDILLRAMSPAGSSGEDEVWRRLVALVSRRFGEVAAERREAPALAAEIFGHPAASQPGLIRTDPRFQNAAVCELLIQRSFEEGFRNPSRAIEIAELALLVTDHLEPGLYGRSVVLDFRARAWAFLGNARRLSFDLTGAEEALDQAESCLEQGSADPMEEARILDLRASLLGDQGRFEQAAEILDAVIDIYNELRESHFKGRAMISKGHFLGFSGWPEDAIRVTRKGLGLLDLNREPRLVLMARHNLAWFLTDCGRAAEARWQLERFRHVYSDFRDPWTELRLAWLDGRIAGGLGQLEKAEEILREVRRRFLADGHGYDASLVTLDLAHLYLQKGRTAEVRELAQETFSVFHSKDVHRQALAALEMFEKAVELDNATPGLAQEISSYLVRARKNPGLKFEAAAA
ncbi:MAG TPA: hypothetical protein VF789_11435 [Thermoanaerobaculia bacterium]